MNMRCYEYDILGIQDSNDFIMRLQVFEHVSRVVLQITINKDKFSKSSGICAD